MDEIKQITIFEETIFPSNEKEINADSFINCKKITSKIFDSWIIGSDLYVKCPCCDFVYKLTCDINPEEFQEMLENYSMKYFKQIVTDCPQRNKHRGVYEHYV